MSQSLKGTSINTESPQAFRAALERFGLPEFRAAWGRINRGIEKESLRVGRNGHLALTPHPEALGSALTHPYITTDYSEALIELITPVSDSIDDTLGFLTDLHKYVYYHLPEGELLWTSSMPCLVENDQQIPLAQYGSSNIGRLKTLYREGLGHRYGRLMQTIAGIHYNFSMPDTFWTAMREQQGSTESLQDFRTRKYLHLIRNFHRHSWLLLYLFGASPAVCRCFARGRQHSLDDFDEATLYRPHATCLRMGNLGYRSDAQRSIFICYNELDNYIDSLHRAMSTPYGPYEAIGLKAGDRFLQMNTNLLQLENEFYATIRPKRADDSGRRPLEVLKAEGIQYIEVRALDLDPFLPLGIDEEQIRFLDAFLLHCLLSDSPECTREEYFEVESNLAKTVTEGRDPALQLKRGGTPVALRAWADELISDIRFSADLLDTTGQTDRYHAAVTAQAEKVRDASLTPSARILDSLRQQQQSFVHFAGQQSVKARDWCMATPLDPERMAHFTQVSQQSLIDREQLEQTDTADFDDFLEDYNQLQL